MTGVFTFSQTFILLLLSTFASVTALLFTPALPGLSEAFDISERTAQWSITIFLISYCIGQLPYGPIANRFGRKKALYIGIGLATFGSLLAYFSFSFTMLCIARLIQGMGAGAGLKVSFTIIGDLLTGQAATKMIAAVSTAFGAMPGIAIAIGGAITDIAGWRGCFLFLFLYSVLMGVFSLFLPETAPKLDSAALQIKQITTGYLRQFKNPRVLLHAVLVTSTTSIYYIFSTISPYLSMERMKMSPSTFGIWNLFPSAGLILGAFFAHKMRKRMTRINILLGILGCFIGTSLMTAFFTAGKVVSWTLFLPQFLILVANNVVWVNSQAEGLTQATDKSNASAVMQFINILGPVLSIPLLGIFSPTTLMLLPASYYLLIGIMIFAWSILKKC